MSLYFFNRWSFFCELWVRVIKSYSSECMNGTWTYIGMWHSNICSLGGVFNFLPSGDSGQVFLLSATLYIMCLPLRVLVNSSLWTLHDSHPKTLDSCMCGSYLKDADYLWKKSWSCNSTQCSHSVHPGAGRCGSWFSLHCGFLRQTSVLCIWDGVCCMLIYGFEVSVVKAFLLLPVTTLLGSSVCCSGFVPKCLAIHGRASKPSLACLP